MKRFLIFTACLMLLVATGLRGIAVSTVGGFYAGAEHTFYVRESGDGLAAAELPGGVRVVANGYTAQVICPADRAAAVKRSLSNIGGESVRFLGGMGEVDQIIDRLAVNIKDSQRQGGLYTVYGYSAAFKDYELDIEGNRINIQIAYRDGTVTVGSPIILGSY